MYECQCTCFLLLQSFLEPRDSSENSSKRDDLHLACLQLHAKQFMEAMLGRNMHRCRKAIKVANRVQHKRHSRVALCNAGYAGNRATADISCT